MSKEAIIKALEALEIVKIHFTQNRHVNEAITALREALAEQPAQQDSTCSNALRAQGKAYPRTCKKCGLGPCIELAATPQLAQQEPVAWLTEERYAQLHTAQRTWVGLTEDERDAVLRSEGSIFDMTEAILKAKNT